MVATIFVFFYDNSEIETKENMQDKIPLKNCKNGDGYSSINLNKTWKNTPLAWD